MLYKVRFCRIRYLKFRTESKQSIASYNPPQIESLTQCHLPLSYTIAQPRVCLFNIGYCYFKTPGVVYASYPIVGFSPLFTWLITSVPRFQLVATLWILGYIFMNSSALFLIECRMSDPPPHPPPFCCFNLMFRFWARNKRLTSCYCTGLHTQARASS